MTVQHQSFHVRLGVTSRLPVQVLRRASSFFCLTIFTFPSPPSVELLPVLTTWKRRRVTFTPRERNYLLKRERQDFTPHYCGPSDNGCLSPLQDASIKQYLSSGAPPNKLVLGLGLYGRTFLLRDPSNPGISAPSHSTAFAGKYTREDGFLGYNEVRVTTFKVYSTL